jgi:hypothetical protein
MALVRDHPMEDGVPNKAGNFMYSETLHKIITVGIDGFYARVQRTGDLLAGVTLSYELQYLALTRRQLFKCGPFVGCSAQICLDHMARYRGA